MVADMVQVIVGLPAESLERISVEELVEIVKLVQFRPC